MVSTKTQNILIGLFIILAILIMVLSTFLFFKPRKELTGHKLLDCVYDNVQISKIKLCFEKFPMYKDLDLLDVKHIGKPIKRIACENLPEIAKDYCIVDMSDDPATCSLLPEFEHDYCIATKKKDQNLCFQLEDSYEQIRCLAELNPVYISQLQEYLIFSNFLQIARQENDLKICDYIEDANLKEICIEKFN